MLDAIGERQDVFLSTPSARRATREERLRANLSQISIHALREEGDLLSMGIVPGMCLFLSTPSARRATLEALRVILGVEISIHALREEGDAKKTKAVNVSPKFLSTPSARRATRPY